MTLEEIGQVLLEQLPIFIDLLIAVLLGFAIGLERKIRSKEAGIRTHTIVCFGSALMMVISKYAFDSSADSARVAAQIVSGVGFLGAGMIVFKRHEVRGLTTAAGVWATAGVGMACGGRLYFVAVFSAAVIVGVQLFFHSKIKIFMHKKSYSIKINFVVTDDENVKIKQIFKVDRFNHLVMDRVDGKMVYSSTINTDVEFSSSALNQIMHENPFIISIERCDND